MGLALKKTNRNLNKQMPEKKKPAEVVDAPDASKKETSEVINFKKRAGEVFASHSVDVLYFTADGTAFLQPQYARIHAESLTSNKITIIKREEI